MSRKSRILLIVAELLFLSAFLLPAFESVVLGEAVTWEGWRATAFAVWALSDLAEDPALALLGLAGLGNIAFLFGPWLLLFRVPSSMALRIFAAAIVGAFVLALWVPHSEIAGSLKLLVGYFAWLLAYAVLFGSLILFRGNKGHRGGERESYA